MPLFNHMTHNTKQHHPLAHRPPAQQPAAPHPAVPHPAVPHPLAHSPKAHFGTTSTAVTPLVSRLANREPRAVDEFYRLYRSRIYAVALRVVGTPWDAEEVLQDVVWIVFRKVEAFRGDAEFSSWLFRVTQNCAKMLLRKRKRTPTPLQDDQIEPTLQRWRPQELGVDDDLAQRQVARQVNAQVAKLDDLNRTIFWSAAVEGDTAQEVGERTGLSVLAVKARLFRIRANLRQETQEILDRAPLCAA